MRVREWIVGGWDGNGGMVGCWMIYGLAPRFLSTNTDARQLYHSIRCCIADSFVIGLFLVLFYNSTTKNSK